GRLVEEIGDVSFLLEEKYIQPMAIANQKPEDSAKRSLIYQFNKDLIATIVDRMVERKETVRDLFESNPQLETLQKFLLPDSNGQHKDHKSAERMKAAQKRLESFEAVDEKREQRKWQKDQDAYLKDKVDLNDYLNH
ncbi:hypothetical protein QP519_11085, partial [Weeksella virosa]|uniref:hypothetical protein n=1 Tax=Weeksella virosa TaxID=1014 RepID=UPI00255281F3